MSERSLQFRILEELGYTNLSISRLAAILNVKMSELKVGLAELEDAKKVRMSEVGGEKVWGLT